MTSLTMDLLESRKTRDFTSALEPQEILGLMYRTLGANPALKCVVDGNTFRVAPSWSWGGSYPGVVEAVVEPDSQGSRIRYARALPPRVQLVLQGWTILSVVVLLLTVGMAAAALVNGEYLSATIALWPALGIVLVWANWRRLARQGRELEAAVTHLLLEGSALDQGAAQQLDAADEARASSAGRRGPRS